ncbi:MAG: thermonuclease family protein [SAR324 cluster bacterium]|nr:thermonuclease family protein [SAR324 cluster bacterium]
MRFLLTAALVCISAPAWAESYGPFQGVLYHRCYDGDTCTFSIQALHPLIGEKINVRIRGIDTPEIRGKCQAEKDKAILARDYLVALMSKAQSTELRNVERGKFFRLLADVYADGQDVSAMLLKKGYAVPYDGRGKRRNWCATGGASAIHPSRASGIHPGVYGFGGGLVAIVFAVGGGLIAYRAYRTRRRRKR